ncbi:MAG: hypothetical protein IPM27_01680 [Nitrosomonadales bacterium]|nr:hypothetical protein [Nitrosomonadales bacterium]
MEDIEIYELGCNVLSTLNRELGEGIYAEVKGELAIQWGYDPIFGAYASSCGSIDQPPQHCVTIRFEFIRQMWRDAENFCDFLNAIPAGSDTDRLYDFYGDSAKLPSCFSKEEQIKNLFMAALTWVYFHEIGHLMQEHGVIRARHGAIDDQKSSEVHEFNAYGNNALTGHAAVVSHTTELAADFEATNFYLMELFRHISDPRFVRQENRAEVFSGLLYLMICGLSIVFYRFNGAFPLAPSTFPEGSHPSPLTRLEINIPHIFEILSAPQMGEFMGHNLDRKQLVQLSQKAALSVALYWSMTNTDERKFDDRFLIRGLLSNLADLQYLTHIVKCWDELLPEILAIRRFGSTLGLLTFTDEFRERITKNVIWGEGAERHLS